MKNAALIGYSGHAFVAADILTGMGYILAGYCDTEEKPVNPYRLEYLGDENSPDCRLYQMQDTAVFVAIGDNALRKKISENLRNKNISFVNAISVTSVISSYTEMYEGIMIGPGAIINSQSVIHNGVIINSGSIIEHECSVGAFSHIAPGAVLCGNVSVGENSFIGAKSVILPGIQIGKNVIVGAGSVVTKDINDEETWYGNPARKT